MIKERWQVLKIIWVKNDISFNFLSKDGTVKWSKNLSIKGSGPCKGAVSDKQGKAAGFKVWLDQKRRSVNAEEC